MTSPKLRGQQSVLLALDTESGKLISAEELLAMDEEALRKLRRLSLSNIQRSGLSEDNPRLRCALCEGPVHISMWHTRLGNRWFAHHGAVTQCPYRTERRMSPEEQFAWQYQGQQEGVDHRYLKHFIADWAEREPDSREVWRDKVRPSDLKPGEWKRPDVRAKVGHREIVFEIQLSYTYLSEVLRRDAFYQQDGVHILWVFRRFEPHREVVRDEFFHNHRNVFVLDEAAEQETVKRGRLTFRCYYQTPTLSGDTVTEKWGSRYVNLDDLIFPEPASRPYYRDFDEARLRLLRLRLLRSVLGWGRHRRKKSDDLPTMYAAVETAWRALGQGAKAGWPATFSEWNFLTEILPILLSIKYGRPIAYRYKTVWEVLNVALGMAVASERPFNILYLMVVAQYRPPLSDEHALRIENHRDEIKRSIRGGETRFLRDERYDAAIALVLPELSEKLASRYGIAETLLPL